MWNSVLIALGSNLGDRKKLLETAWQLLASPQIRLGRLSRFIETEPFGTDVPQGLFLNAAGILETTLSPYSLLDELNRIENELGRQRSVRFGPRTVDLDILLYGDLIISTERLTIPHPRMTERLFVLESAAEIAPDWVVPSVGLTIDVLSRLLRSIV